MIDRIRCERNSQDAQVQVSAAVVVCFVEFHHTAHRRFDLRNFCYRAPIVGPCFDPPGPSRGKAVQYADIGLLGLGYPLREYPVRVCGGGTQFCVLRTESPSSVVEGAGGQALPACGVFDEGAGVGAVEVGAGQKQVRVFRVAFDQGVEHHEIGRRRVAHRLDVVLVENRGGEVVGHPARGRADQPGAAARANQ
jgi:hypothetical protein